MTNLELRCRLDTCIIDHTTHMELKKCVTQNQSDAYQPCPYLHIATQQEHKKGEVWKKFGDMIDKSKKKNDQ
jgi:hypothetical protein